MSKFFRENILAFILPSLIIFLIFREFISRSVNHYQLDWGLIQFFLMAIPVTFFVVFLALKAMRSNSLGFKIIAGFIYSVVISYVVCYWLVFSSNCDYIVNKGGAESGLSYLAVLMAFPFLGVLSTPLLLIMLGLAKHKLNQSKNIFVHIVTFSPIILSLVYLVVMVFSWGRFAELCQTIPWHN
ncbi:MAG TPA: hypothetical protein VLI92_02660 [Candidatus Saccharimonadales bacterium]|nr:hypothetical protein [Candidatus Saccharimonadales bacterium]